MRFLAYGDDKNTYYKLMELDDVMLDTISRVAVCGELRRKAKIVLTHNPASLALALARA